MGLEKIREYQKRMGITSQELSERSGVPKGTLDKILSGVTKDPKLETLKAIARVLNCSLDDFDDEDSPNKISNTPPYAQMELLIARRGNKLSTEERMHLIKLLSENEK